MTREIETTCPKCGENIYKDEKATTSFCEACSREV